MNWPPRLAVIVKRRGLPVRQKRFGSEWRDGPVHDLRAGVTPRRSRRFAMRWATRFDAAWTEGAALSLEEAIAYAQRGHGERKRPSTGWASLTPTELDVVRLVSEGLGNKDIAARLFVSPSHGADPPDARVRQARHHIACATGPGGGPPRADRACRTVRLESSNASVRSIG